MNFRLANRIAPDGTPHSAASHLGLFCLPMSYKRDTRLKLVKCCIRSDLKSSMDRFRLLKCKRQARPKDDALSAHLQ